MMNSKRNQTIAIARFLMYKHSLNQQLDGMTDEEYLADPIGLDVGSYVKDLMRYCPEKCGGSGHGASGRAFEAAGDGLSLCDCVYAL